MGRSPSKLNTMLRHKSPKILILESQLIIAADLSLQFSKLGYDVIGINTCAEDALRTIAENSPDIVVMNIKFEGNAAGLKMARIISETYQTPVIFISANADKEIFELAISIQAYAFIAKPFEKKDLQRGIETTLNRMAAEGQWTRLRKAV